MCDRVGSRYKKQVAELERLNAEANAKIERQALAAVDLELWKEHKVEFSI